MRRMMAISGLCAISVAIALVGCSTGDRLAVHESTSFDELMPRPVRSLQSEDQTVPVERLQNVKVVKGPVPEKARMFESYICDRCGEQAGARWIREIAGEKVCEDCLTDEERANA